jgi:hypothetical protein
MMLTPTMNFRWLRRVVTVTYDGQSRTREETVLQQRFDEERPDFGISLSPKSEWLDVPTVTS